MIRASIDQVKWANTLRKLSKAMGKSIGEVMRGQAKLIVRDATRFTPPFADRPIKESFKKQRDTGNMAVLADHRKFYREASMFNLLAKGAYGERIAKLIETGKREEALVSLQERGLQFIGISRQANKDEHARYRDRRGRIRTKKGFLLHSGQLPEFDASLQSAKAMPGDPRLKRMVKAAMKRVGNAKSGWVVAANALGVKLPQWIKRQRGSTEGGYLEQGREEKLIITMQNRVPYMQGRRELAIVNRALKNRQRNAEKQLAAVLRANLKAVK